VQARARIGKRARLGRWAGVILTVGATGGCGLLHQAAAPAGMERQIRQGEQVSAATQAHVSPAGRSAGTGTQAAGRSSAGPGTVGTGPATAALPRPSATPGKVTGNQVTAIGDSVMAASAMALAAAMPGIYIDAKPDRQMPAGLAIVRRLAAAGRLRPVVVIGLGTNYIVTTRQLNELMKVLGPNRKLVLINTYVPDAWSKQVNATEAAFIRQHPSVTPADWYDTIRNRMNLLWPDHIHPEIPGTYVYARMVRRAVQAPATSPLPEPRLAGPEARVAPGAQG
jgi:hypothetical protein